MRHTDRNVEQSLMALNDALCEYERNTSRQSVLILREEGGFVHRSVSGKPVHTDIHDSALMNILKGK